MAFRELQYFISLKDNVSRGLGDAGIAFAALGKDVAKVNKAMIGVGVASLLMGAALVKSFAGIMSAAANWETQMHEIWTLMDTEPKKALDGIQESLFALSARVPQSLEALADGLYWVMSSGYKGAEAISVLEQSAMLAVATLADTETAARVLVGTMQAFALGASEATRVSDILFKTIEIGIVNMEELAGPWGALIGVAGMTGVTIEEVGAAFATLTREGLNSARSGTAIMGMMNNIMGATPALVKAWSTVSSETIQVTLAQEGLTGVVSKLDKLLGGQTLELIEVANAAGDDEEAFEALAKAKGLVTTELKEMFPNLRGLVGFMGLLANGGVLWKMSLEEMATATGATRKAYEKMMDTFQSKWQLAKNAFNRLKISVGQGILPLFSALADIFAKVGNALDKLPQPIKNILGALIGISGLVLIFGGLLALIGQIGPYIVAALQIAAPYIAIFVAIVAGLIIVIELIKKNWDKIYPAIISAWNKIYPVLVDFRDWIVKIGLSVKKSILDVWEKIKNPLLNVLKLISKGFDILWETLVKVWNQIKGPLSVAFKELNKLGKELWRLMEELWPVFKVVAYIIGGVLLLAFVGLIASLRIAAFLTSKLLWVIQQLAKFFRIIASVIKKEVSIIVGAFQYLWDKASPIFDVIKRIVGEVAGSFKIAWDKAVQVFQEAWDSISRIWDATGGKLIESMKRIWNIIPIWWTIVWNLISVYMGIAWDGVSKLFHGLFDPLVSFAKTMWDEIEPTWSSVWWNIENALMKVWFKITTLYNKWYWPLKYAAEHMWDAVAQIWSAVWSVIKDALNIIWGTIVIYYNYYLVPLGKAAAAIWDALGIIWQVVWGAIMSMLTMVWNTIISVWDSTIGRLVGNSSSMWNGIQEAWTSVWSGIYNAIAPIWQKIKQVYDSTIGALGRFLFGSPGTPTNQGAPQAHLGGMVTPYGIFHGGGEVGAILRIGEYVINAESANRLGKNLLDSMNRTGQIPRTVSAQSDGGGTIINIQNLNLYGITNAQEIFDELNQMSNRVNIRNKASKESW